LESVLFKFLFSALKWLGWGLDRHRARKICFQATCLSLKESGKKAIKQVNEISNSLHRHLDHVVVGLILKFYVYVYDMIGCW